MPTDNVLLYVQPRASRSEVDGTHGDAIRVRIKAPPVEGAANTELVRFLARHVRVPASAVHIVSGARGRRKRVAVDGMTAAAIVDALLSAQR